MTTAYLYILRINVYYAICSVKVLIQEVVNIITMPKKTNVISRSEVYKQFDMSYIKLKT